jgi:two-component system sensor histidine kinase MtrB
VAALFRHPRLAGARRPGWLVGAVRDARRLVGRLVDRRRMRLRWARLRRRWRRSLQIRVVSLTLVLSGLLVFMFGWLVVSTITSGLLDAKVKTARHQVQFGVGYADRQLKGINQANDPALRNTVPAVVAQLGTTRDQGGPVDVVMLSRDGSGDALAGVLPKSLAWPDKDAYGVVISDDLSELRQKVGTGKVMRQIVTVALDGRAARPTLVFGTPVGDPGANLQMYYLFPLDNESETADLVRTTVFATGLALVVLLAMVAALVTRMVVTPVRVAARTAQRLSAGLLDQRMEVHGEDDLARLAASFNQMATSLQRQIVRLEEMSRLQRRFTSDVSHELRTPLTTVRMAADLIFASRADFDPAVARSAELLQAELDRFETLLSDLLEISRFDAGFALLDAEPADLVPIVRQAVDHLGSLADQAGSPIEVVVPDSPVIAEIDPRRVERVLRNLVGNAVEHGEGQPVRVTLRADDTAVAVTVRDRGVGLNPGEDKLVFNRFWRADPSRARQTGGTGLGLSISLEDARLHGGWLESWGAPGQGAQFRLTLPIRAGDRLVSSPLRLVPEDARFTIDPVTAGPPAGPAIEAPAGPDDAGRREPVAIDGGGAP